MAENYIRKAEYSMKALIQRVSFASVHVEESNYFQEIQTGLLVFLGIGKEDTENDVQYLSNKIVNIRIFEDSNRKMNLSVRDIKGEILLISQFTLYADTRKGNRPGFDSAAPSETANVLFEKAFTEIANLIGIDNVKKESLELI